MEDMGITAAFWRGKKVFITGHTGFKGSWLSLWLQALEARVFGYALEPPTDPNLFSLAGIEEGMVVSTISDIRDIEKLKTAVLSAEPEIVFHLAAQPVVRHSYNEPVNTYATNVMGTVHLFEAVRCCPTVKTVVNVTSDKCYENHEWVWGYRENEPLGGHDPYSSSKACSELITSAYRRSFFDGQGIALASARAGNVIGGGDWAADRLIPDFFRAVDSGNTLMIRAPQAVRPWQHVLEPLSGYLMLAEQLYLHDTDYAGPWNFGPADEDARSVGWIVERLAELWPEADWKYDAARHPHEAGLLRLDSGKARSRLGWRPRWDLETALTKTSEWHRARRHGANMREFTLNQIAAFNGTALERMTCALHDLK